MEYRVHFFTPVPYQLQPGVANVNMIFTRKNNWYIKVLHTLETVWVTVPEDVLSLRSVTFEETYFEFDILKEPWMLATLRLSQSHTAWGRLAFWCLKTLTVRGMVE